MTITYHDNLPNKPLVEAILEIKWGEPNAPDPAYPIMVGRLYEKLRGAYPAIEDLPLAQAPPIVAVHVARHRFRTGNQAWPLVQIGPGVVTLNDTERYQWEDFRKRALELCPSVKDSHPDPDRLDITSITLRYIDAVEFDFERNDLREFLREKLHIAVSVPESLFDNQPVSRQPAGGMLQLAFPTKIPAGQVELSISTARKSGRPAVVWNTLLVSAGADARSGWQDFPTWLDAAYAVVRHWFFALIQGDLEKEFLQP